MRTDSVSKQFTALTILSLVDTGQISLSDTVYAIFPYETFKSVTFEQLINHTSGRPNAQKVFLMEWDSTKIAENKDVLEWYSKENLTITKPREKSDLELKAYYLRRVESGQSKMSTLNIIRNKIVHRIFAVVKRGTPYVPLYQHAA